MYFIFKTWDFDPVMSEGGLSIVGMNEVSSVLRATCQTPEKYWFYDVSGQITTIPDPN